MKKEELNKLIIISCVILFMLFFIVFTGKYKKEKEVIIKIPSDEVIKVFDNINDNYSLTIEEYVNDELNKIVYYNDSKIELYEYKNKGYIYYKDKLFELNEDKKTIKKVKKQDFINNPYYDINYIKKLIPYCDSTYVNTVKLSCKIKLSDYLKEYNEYYNKSITSEEDEIIEIFIVHYAERLGKILIDYSNINKIIKGEYLNTHYGIKISNINSNDFSEVLDHYKKDLNK